MATKLMAVVVVVVAMLTLVGPVMADGGTDNELVETLLAVRDTGVAVGKTMDKFYVHFCKAGFLDFTQGSSAAPSYCTVGVARAFVGGQLNKAGTSYTCPKGWTSAEFTAFVRWTAAQ